MNTGTDTVRRSNLTVPEKVRPKKMFKLRFRRLCCLLMILMIISGSTSLVYAQDTSTAPSAKNIYVTNNFGQPDTVLVTKLSGGDIVKIYSSENGTNLLGTATLPAYNTEVTIKVPQLGADKGSIYVSVKSVWMLESSRTKVNYAAEPKSEPLLAGNVYITNNAGSPDTIEISGLYGGEAIKVYNAAAGGRMIGSANVGTTKSSVTINIPQLGVNAGKVYITVAYKGEHESDRTPVDYLEEPKTTAPNSGNIMINNNVGKPDNILVTNLYGGEVIKVYNAASGGRLLGSLNVPNTASEATVNIAQLGSSAGTVYVTVTNKGEQESARTPVNYEAEPKTEALKPDSIYVTNNAGLPDTVYVNYLSVGDTVKVYSAQKGGSILGTATIGTSKTDALITITQLSKQAGSVFVSVTSKGMLESDRTESTYKAELQSEYPKPDNITIVNNGGTPDTITITGLLAGDIVKIYDSISGGSLLGTATVAASKSEATVSISQLGSSDGSVYVSVTTKGYFESDRTEVIYSAETKSATPNAASITITNNSGKADTVYVTNLTEGDVVKVYDSSTGGKQLGTATVSSGKSEVTVSIAQLGSSAGSAYVSVTSKDKLESSRRKVSYISEPVTDVIADYEINVINNPTGKSDTVQVYNLSPGDVVKVYDADTGGKLLGSATVASTATDVTITISQLGASEGNVYVTVTSANKLESQRIKVAYDAESKSGEIDADNVTIVNNKAGTPDTIEVTGLSEGDVVKVYSAAAGGKLLGTATVPAYGSYVTVTITQLGTTAGSVYISVTGANKLESGRIQVDYAAESKSGIISADDINIKNNAAGTPDIIEVNGLNEGDVVKVYDAAKGGNLLGTSTVESYSTYTTVTVSQLGTSAGSVYVTVTSPNKIESDRVKADYDAESKSGGITKDDVLVINNAGTPDIVQVSGLDTGDMVKIYDASRGGNLLGSGTVNSGSDITISIDQLGRAGGSIYVTVTKKNKAESDRIEVKYEEEGKSNPPSDYDISIINNFGADDTVKVSNLTNGDIVNVYDSERAGNLLGTASVSNYDSYAVVTITQLGTSQGTVYVSVIRKGKQESSRVAAAYNAEPKSGEIDPSNIIVSNNAGAADTVLITGLSGGDIVNVYDSEKGGSLLGTATVSTYDSYAIVTVTQIGTKAGTVYVTVTTKGKLESARIPVAYAAEQKSDPPYSGSITISNNAGISDTITVAYLEEGDIVKVYNAESGGVLLGMATVPADSGEAVVKVTQLGSAAGKVYITVTSPNELESDRTMADYPAEATTDAPDSTNISISNNVKIADTITVTFLQPEDTVKVYNASTGGSVLGTAIVPSDSTQVTISISQLGNTSGTVYVTVTSKGKKESARTPARYLEEQKSDPVSAGNVIVVNNAGMYDTVTVTYLDAGDVIKVYDAPTGGNLLGTATVTTGSREAEIKISQLGYYAGYVYITVTDYGKLESDRVKVGYTPEPVSDAPELAKITITNNSGKSDTIYITGLTEYDVVKVYDSPTGGSLLGTGTVAIDSTTVTIKITQLGVSAGNVYISVTSKGAVESSRTKAGYNAE